MTALGFQIFLDIVDVVKEYFGLALRGDAGVEVAYCARDGVARVFKRFLRRFVVLFQNAEPYDGFALHFHKPLVFHG